MNAVEIRRIRLLLLIFIAGLLISGATAIPLETEVRFFARLIQAGPSASWE